jgi:hypothetical protein
MATNNATIVTKFRMVEYFFSGAKLQKKHKSHAKSREIVNNLVDVRNKTVRTNDDADRSGHAPPR